jgi:1-deoxy-D-xylulose-5-phosphate synthase
MKLVVVNARFIKPLDTDLIRKQVNHAEKIITIENGVITGGFGESLEVEIGKFRLGVLVMKYGWPDEFVEHGSVEQLKEIHGLTVEKILQDIL